MSIGGRLREERERLGLSQSDFAALAGAKKGAQLKWEKNASSPTAAQLKAFAEAGADVLYVLTGDRSTASPGSSPRGGTPDNLTALHEASGTLDRAERLTQGAETWPIPPGDEELEALRLQLNDVARRDDLPEAIRARADWILHYALGDPGARERYRRRSKRVGLSLKHAIRELEELEEDLGWQPPRAMHHALMALHFKIGLDREDIMDLLSACKAAMEQRVTA